MFDDEVQSAVDHLRSGMSVEVVGQRGIGRTTLTRRVVAELERTGASVLSLTGLTSTVPEPYVSLRLAGVETPKDGPTLYGFVDRVARELARGSSAYVVLDDVLTIDEDSLAVVTVARERLDAPVLVTSLPFRRGLTSAQRWFPAEKGVRITLGPLSYEETSALVHRLLGGRVASDVVAHVYAKSSGITSLVRSIVHTATLSRRIEETDGVWRMAGDTLWNPHLQTVIEQLLAGLDDEDFRTVYELALLGSATMEQITVIDRVASVERLEERGLVSVVGQQPLKALVSLNPLAIVDYFRKRPLDVAGMVHSRRLSELLQVPESKLFQAARQRIESSAVSALPAPPEPGGFPVLARYFTDRMALERVAHEERVATDPSLANILSYLGALLEWQDDPERIEALFEQTDHRSDGATRGDLVLYGVVKALWYGLARHDARAVARALTWMVQATGDADGEAHAIQVFLRVVSTGVRPDDLDWLHREVRRRQDCWVSHVVLAATLTIHGDPRGALAAMEDRPATTPAIIERYLDFFRAVALVDGEDGALATRTTTRFLRESQLELDRPRVTLFAYAAALRTFVEGRWEEGVNLLSEIFTLGAPGEISRGVHGAMLRLGADLMFRTGRGDVASSFLMETEGVPDGPLPWMQRGVDDAIRALMAGDVGQAADILTTIGREAEPKGYWSVVRAALQVATALDPTLVRLDVLDRACGLSPEPQALSGYRATVRQVLTDPLGVEQHLAAYEHGRDDYFLLRTLVSFAQRSDPELREHVTAAARQLEVRLGRTPLVVRQVEDTNPSLTARELEVALLVGAHTSAEVASALGISRRTVENHIFRALKKTGASSRAELAEIAVRARVEVAG
ncbi:hypothetical protein ASE27_17905 [Oerskovia sp. Root918]|uniref:helix-turn-helix transcriptional regulator n=1 Tax=unclassified Oerskovia TaxID=2619021 RepID=UPI0006F5B322|nr:MULTISPECIES: LuxR C-terminal-related transcriptional regulator [unclassified Oerskovia]KRC42083.1 hypothetical protein ASE15_19125 [Oerskovia sp. Root22]KRD42707.1 hypothetical protein ASE27_17905 [Oerskovia sp. Root918]